MGWSPPRKVTVVLTLFIEIFGLLLGLGAHSVFELGVQLDPIFVIVGFGLCFVGWLVLLLGVMIRGL
ncbi:MAG: hypothetical protein HWN65_04170 [Candidatus Helarchaeota archaeon]|nr:hypothetical protein [Candidatus Helarchaeota archaeon]